MLLHPGQQEAAGWVVGEAQAVGVHPIVFRGAGAASIGAAAGIGTLVDPEQLCTLTEALRAALAAPRAPISDRWSADRLIDILARWYAFASRTHQLEVVR